MYVPVSFSNLFLFFFIFFCETAGLPCIALSMRNLRANFSIKVILVLKLSYRARVTFCRSPQVQGNRLLPAHRETGINKKSMGSRLTPSTMVWKETPLSFMDSLARNTA
jgi:hypothetical protein